MRQKTHRDFRPATHKVLAKRGIRVIHSAAIPMDAHDDYLSAKGYEVDDNGTLRVWTFAQVLAAADIYLDPSV